MQRLTRPRFGASGDQYGQAYGTQSYSAPDCAPACAPTVLGNAGIPGCGTGTLPGTECKLKVLFRRSDTSVAAVTNATVEALAGRAGAFKPRAVYMIGIGEVDPSVNGRFEILNVTVMGNPQLVNFDGVTVAGNRGITDFFNLQCMPQPVDWQVFGASAGQGLQITVRNPDPALAMFFYLSVWGDAADTSLIGRA